MATTEQVLPTLEAEAKAKFPNIDLQGNTVEHDVFLRSPALLVGSEDRVQRYATRTSTPSAWLDLLSDANFINTDLPIIFGTSTVAEAQALMSVEIDAMASNYGLTRNPGALATGFESLIFGSAASVTVVAGTLIRTSSESLPVRFTTTQTFSGAPILVGGVYKVVLPVEASLAGDSGNLPANTLVVAEGSIPRLVSITNESDMRGGVNPESDTSLLQRIITSFQGLAIDTVQGVRTVALNAGAFDAQVFRVGDPETRNRPGPDVLVVEETSTSVAEAFTFQAVHQAGYVPATQPVSMLDVASISLSGHPLAQFLVIQDSSVNARSSRAQDRIVIYGVDVPAIGETVTLTYPALYRVAQYQALYSAPNPELFFDVLVKTAIRKDVALTVNVVLYAGVDSTAVIPNVRTAVLNFVNALKMGVTLAQSDLIAVMENVSGVSRVNLPLNFFGDAAATSRVVENTITASTSEYIRMTSANLILTVV